MSNMNEDKQSIRSIPFFKSQPQFRKAGLLVSILLLFLFNESAYPQDRDSQPDLYSLEEVIVTASKKETTEMEFPGSLTVKEETFIDERGIDDLNDFTRYIPNVYLKKTSSGNALVTRGISTIDTSLYSPMGLYINDVAYPLSFMLNQRIFDIERIEVLRGPQSTLYGKNSESGVINIVLKQPDQEQRTRVLLERGNYDTYKAGLSFSGPVVADRFFVRLSLLGLQTDGYMENEVSNEKDVADEKSIFARGTLRWTPSADLDISLIADHSDRDKGISFMRAEDGPNASDRLKVRSNEDDNTREKDSGQALRVSYAWDDLNLLSITGHKRFTKDFIHDFDRSPTELGYSDMDVDHTTGNQEFRLSSSKDDDLSWLIGLFASRETLDTRMTLNHVSALVAKDRKTDSERNEYALFGQTSFSPRERLNISSGLRFDSSTASGKQEYTSYTGTTEYRKDLDETNLLPMASVSWDLSENATVYSLYSQGWLAGGFNYFSATSKDNFWYKSEKTYNYEVGFKSNFYNKKLKANLSLFHIRIDDKQIREEVPGGGAGVWKFTNAGKAHINGYEIDVTCLATDSLTLVASLGYATSTITEWSGEENSGESSYEGNSLPWSPEFTGNIGASYYHPNGLFGVVDLFAAGKQYFDAANTLKDEGYRLVNLKLGYQYRDLSVSVWGKNLLDDEYVNKKVQDNSGYTLVEDGKPRTYGITFNWRV